MSAEAYRPTVRCLSFHADYRCRNSGVCCSSSWDIAVEQSVELKLRPRLSVEPILLPNGPDGFTPMADPPPGCRSMFRRTAKGSCWFHDAQGQACAIHRGFGESALPSACRQFPRICVLEPSVVSVSLSHYCPTAAATLFGDSVDFRIVTDPAAFPSTWPFEGLDARHAYSPFLRPGVLLGFDGLRTFENFAISALATQELRVSLARVISASLRMESRTPSLGDVPGFVESAFASSDPDQVPAPGPIDPRRILQDSLPEGGPPVADLPALTPGVSRFPESLPARIDIALRRYLAARLIGSWIPFQASRFGTVGRYLDLCLQTVLMFQATADPGGDAVTRWTEAIRSADLWLLHQCDPERLASNLG